MEGGATLTPLIGRDQEFGLLLDRWEQVKEGRGQVILLSGEPGIGKSRLAHTLREYVAAEGSLLYEARCSPYHQQSALYPLMDVLQRTLLFTRHDSDDEKVERLERALGLYNLQDTLPLFTALLSLPTPAQYPSLNLTPQKQKERTLQALLQWLIAQAERQATVSVWEDLHWADPSSLEFLTLLIEQIPTAKLLLVLTFRPDFTPPWKPRSHISQLVLNRLGKKQVEVMIAQAAVGINLSPEVIEQIRVKTDGVPLFVEELTKSVIESVGATHAAPLSFSIPATLQETLLARLDRLADARQVAQLGATLGREFSYDLLHEVALLSEADLQSALSKLVEAEILYQRGVGEQARYFFKHALIQDTAYQSLLKSTRVQYHQQIARVLEERFLDIKANQPELLAYHYTEAGLIEQAIPYWQLAGWQANGRSANQESINHSTKGLDLLKTLPETPDRAQLELRLQLTLAGALMVTRGYAAPELGKIHTRVRELSQHLGETRELLSILYGLAAFYLGRAELHTSRELSGQLFTLAQRIQDPLAILMSHFALVVILHKRGELTAAQEHGEKALSFIGTTGITRRLGKPITVASAASIVWLGFSGCWVIRTKHAKEPRKRSAWRKRWLSP
jgi:predicted ATPase